MLISKAYRIYYTDRGNTKVIRRNGDPLRCDLLAVDETSMVESC